MSELKDFSLKSNTANPGSKSKLDLVIDQLPGFDDKELAELRYALDALLPLDLGKLDLAEELALQFRQAKVLLVEVQRDATTPANQKAQIFNSVRAQLESIVKQQEVVWSMERLKKFEVAFIKAANLLTPEARDAFFDLYGEFLQDPNKATGAAPAPAHDSGVQAPRMLVAQAPEVPRPDESPTGTGGISS
jgi:hypothetical protein